MSDFVIKSNNAYILLEDNLESFEKEARLIDEIKCYLINFDNLDEFNYEDAEVEDSGIGYNVYYDDKIYELETRDGMILSYWIKNN